MQELNSLLPSQQLDMTLKILIEATEHLPGLTSELIADTIERNRGYKCNIRYVDFIMIQLKLDGYVSDDPAHIKGFIANGVELTQHPYPVYCITFTGRYFIQNGGYARVEADRVVKKEDMERQAQQLKNLQEENLRIQKSLERWTRIAAVVATLFFVWDMVKFGIDHNCRKPKVSKKVVKVYNHPPTQK